MSSISHVTEGGVTRTARRRRKHHVGFHVSMTIISLIWFSPIVFVVFIAVRPFSDIVARGLSALPTGISLEGFQTALTSGGVGSAFVNSAIVTVSAVVLSLLLASMAAYALSKYKIPGARTVLLIMLAGNLLPPQILLIPVARITDTMHIYNTLLALVLVQVGFGLGFYTFVLYGFMRGIPGEVFEAAKLDGAGPVRIYGSVVIPLSRPALGALTALATTWIFNDLLWTLTVLQTETKFPLTAELLNLQGGYVSQWNVVAAGAIIGALPMVIVFLIFQRQFVSGILVGITK